MSRRLRCQGFAIQPIVVWDDGENLQPGPTLNVVSVPAGDLVAFAARWPGEFAEFRAQAEETDAAAGSKPNRAQRRAKKPAGRD